MTELTIWRRLLHTLPPARRQDRTIIWHSGFKHFSLASTTTTARWWQDSQSCFFSPDLYSWNVCKILPGMFFAARLLSDGQFWFPPSCFLFSSSDFLLITYRFSGFCPLSRRKTTWPLIAPNKCLQYSLKWTRVSMEYSRLVLSIPKRENIPYASQTTTAWQYCPFTNHKPGLE